MSKSPPMIIQTFPKKENYNYIANEKKKHSYFTLQMRKIVVWVMGSYDPGLGNPIIFKWCQKHNHLTSSWYTIWNGKRHFLLSKSYRIQPGMSREFLTPLLAKLGISSVSIKTPWNVESKTLLKPNISQSLLSLLYTGSLILLKESSWPAMAHFLTPNFSVIHSYTVLEVMWNVNKSLDSSLVKVDQLVKWMLRF